MNNRARFTIVAMYLISVTGLTAASFAADRILLLNYDVNIATAGSDGDSASIQQHGIRFSPQGQFHGKNMGHYDYIFSVRNVTDKGGQLTIEVYRFGSRKKIADPVSEYVTDVDFEFGIPVQVEANTTGFSVDIALSISSR